MRGHNGTYKFISFSNTHICTYRCLTGSITSFVTYLEVPEAFYPSKDPLCGSQGLKIWSSQGMGLVMVRNWIPPKIMSHHCPIFFHDTAELKHRNDENQVIEVKSMLGEIRIHQPRLIPSACLGWSSKKYRRGLNVGVVAAENYRWWIFGTVRNFQSMSIYIYIHIYRNVPHIMSKSNLKYGWFTISLDHRHHPAIAPTGNVTNDERKPLQVPTEARFGFAHRSQDASEERDVRNRQ